MTSRFRFISTQRATFGVKRLCRVLAVSRSGFYRWAELGGIAGFMAFDAYAHADAKRAFGFSLRCAEESRDWHLRASILSMLGPCLPG